MHAGLRAARAVLASCALGACATATRTTVDYLYVITDPPGAAVTTSHGQSCTTPCTLILPRRADFEVALARDGYAPWSGRITCVRKGAKSPFDTAPAQAAGGAVTGATAGFAAASASGELGLTLGGGLGATSAGASMITAGLAAGVALPFAVDAATGANRDFTPNPLVVHMTPLGAEEDAP